MRGPAEKITQHVTPEYYHSRIRDLWPWAVRSSRLFGLQFRDGNIVLFRSLGMITVMTWFNETSSSFGDTDFLCCKTGEDNSWNKSSPMGTLGFGSVLSGTIRSAPLAVPRNPRHEHNLCIMVKIPIVPSAHRPWPAYPAAQIGLPPRICRCWGRHQILTWQ